MSASLGDGWLRGRFGTEVTVEMGLQIGRIAGRRYGGPVAVACDTRPSGEALTSAVKAGIMASGQDVIDMGRLPTSALQYYIMTHDEVAGGIMITASHSPMDYNGFKFIAASGRDDPALEGMTAESIMAETVPTAPREKIGETRGVNGELEMAAAFQKAGFESIDVHMTDILEGRVSLKDFNGLVACGGFSYGDVLGAGEGWAKSILFNPKARAEFEAYFNRKDTFTLGVCNGCQMVSNLKDLIPGAKHWPRFVQNLSERFEARFCTLKVEDTPAVLLKGMAGSVLPIAVAHGEGRAEFASRESAEACLKTGLVALRYVDGKHEYTERYPLNPNGSPFGINGLCSEDGRAMVMMPHPERVFRTCQYSWHPAEWGEDGPWMQLFRNGRIFVAEKG